MIQSYGHPVKASPAKPSRELLIVIATTVALWLIGLLIAAIFNISRYVADVPSYWSYSAALGEFNVYHLPLYPLILAPIQLIAPPDFQPLGIMSIITGLAWIGGTVVVYYVFRLLNTGLPAVGAFLFAVLPIVGLGYTLVPVADVIGRTLFVVALLCYLDERRWLTVFVIALVLITHKILWLNVVLFALIAIYQRRLSIVQVIASGIPLAIYTLLGAVHHSSLTWIFSGSLEHTRIDTSNILTHFPIFDTILGRFANGGMVNWMVGLVVLMVVIAALFLLVSSVWRKQPILLSFIIPPILIATVMGAAGSVVVLRFSPFLFIPLWAYLFPQGQARFRLMQQPAVLVIIGIVCVISQFFFLFYIESYFA